VGRIVKNPPSSDELYVVAPPHPISNNGKVRNLESTTFEALPDVGHAEPEPVLPPAPETQPIDWPALHREAAELIEMASADAEALVAEARALVRTIVETAQHGAGGVTEHARSEGYSLGHTEGTAAAEREMEEMLVTMRGLIDMARVERHKMIETAEPEIVKLATGIAERILHKAVELDREVVVAMTKAAVSHLVDRESITVRVNPIDLERMKQHRDNVLALGETKHMRVIEDQRVDPGGVVVETDAGSLDAKVATQIEEAKRVLRVESGDVIVEPAPESPLRAANGPAKAGKRAKAEIATEAAPVP
jgi:flagellar assembly protein FliH